MERTRPRQIELLHAKGFSGNSLHSPDHFFGGSAGKRQQLRRREFITLLSGAAAAWPLAAHAQQSERMRRIGVLITLAADDPEAQATAPSRLLMPIFRARGVSSRSGQETRRRIKEPRLRFEPHPVMPDALASRWRWQRLSSRYGLQMADSSSVTL
jgi:hypothetical protein